MFWKANILFTIYFFIKIESMVKYINHPPIWWCLHNNFISLIYEMEGIFSRTLKPIFQYLIKFFQWGHFLAWCKTSWVAILAGQYFIDHILLSKMDPMVKWVNHPPARLCFHNNYIPHRWEMVGIFLRLFRPNLGAKQAEWLFG